MLLLIEKKIKVLKMLLIEMLKMLLLIGQSKC